MKIQPRNQVERTTANPFHVFSHFSTGTRQTLTVEKGAERSLRYELFQFYRYFLSGSVNEFQPSPNLVKILKSNLATCGETPSLGSALTPISCRHT